MKKKLLLVLFIITSISAISQTWTGGGINTNWNNTDNWNNTLVPTGSDDVIIPTGFTVTLNVAGNVKSIEVQGNSVLEITTNLTFTGPSIFGANTTINWSGGTLNGTASTISNIGTVNLIGSGIKIISGNTTFNNSGTLNITSVGDLWITQGILNNQVAGIIDMQADNGNIAFSGGSSHVLNNAGLIKRTSSIGEAQIIVELNNNNGTVQVESGTLSFQNSTGKNLTNGIYNVSVGATMDWDTNVTLSGTISGTINGTLNWTNNVEVPTAAIMNFIGSGTVNWVSGSLHGGGTLTSLGTINLSGSGIKIITGDTTLNNSGTINITSVGDLWITQGTLNNQASGVIDMQAENGDITWSGGSSHILNNAGLIKRTISGGEAQIVVELNNNNGIIQVETGILSFQNAIGKNLTDGTYNVFSGAVLDWDGIVNPLGTLDGTINGSLNWNSLVNIPVSGATTFNFSGSGNFNWAVGELQGGGTLTNLGTINLPGSGIKIITGDSTLNNAGTINLTGVGDLRITQGILNNQASGVIDMQAENGNITWSGGSSHILNNAGLIKRTTSVGEAQLVVLLNNNGGTIQVESGTLSFQDAIGKNLTDGTYNVFSGAVLDWDGTVNPLGTLSGVIDGDLNWNSIVNIPFSKSATFNFTGSGNFNWTVSQVQGGGILNNLSTINLSGNGIKVITGDTILNNAGTINLIGTGDLWITQGILNNQFSGIIDMQAENGNITWSGGSSHILNNAGLIKRTTTAGEAQLVVLLNNNGGTVQVESGTLSFQDAIGKNLTDGIYNVFSGAVLDWDGSVNPLGTLTGVIDGDLNWNNIVNIPIAGEAAFNFSGLGNFNWTVSQLQGGGILNNFSTINLTGNGIKIITGDTTLNNAGTINITGAGDLWITQGVVNNQAVGIIDLQTDNGDITWSGGSSHILNNAGLIKRTTSAGLVQMSAQINNSGTIEVVSGTLEITNFLPFVNEETGIVKGIGIFDLPPVSGYTNNGTFAPGLSIGTLSILGNFTSTSTSVLDIELNGLIPSIEHDVLAITGTNVVFDGSVAVTMGFEGTIGNQFTIATTTGTIATANLQSPIGNVDFDGFRYTFDVSYPDNNKVVLTIVDKVDILPPNVITQNITVPLDANGNASITAGQIDNGSTDNHTPTNQLQFSLDIDAFTCSELGNNTVQLTVTDNAGNFATLPATVTVVDVIVPTITCPINFTVQAPGPYELPDYLADNTVAVSDNCTLVIQTQTPVAGTLLANGDHTISFEVFDAAGNTNTCSFLLTVEVINLSSDGFELSEKNILMFPNPVVDKLTIKNMSHVELLDAEIIDVTGKALNRIDLSNMGNIKEITLENYASGMYFIRVKSFNSSITKRIIKE